MNAQQEIPSFGNAGGRREFISLEARAVLVEMILTLATGSETREALRKIGVIRGERSVMNWMRRTREWMGIPGHYPSIYSQRYRDAVAEWASANERPTREHILSGWQPGGDRHADSGFSSETKP